MEVFFRYVVLKVHETLFLDSSMVEHAAVNRRVVGSSPTRGVFLLPGSSAEDPFFVPEAF